MGTMNDVDKVIASLKIESLKNKRLLSIFKKQQAKAIIKLHLSNRISISVVPETSTQAVHI